MNNCSFAAQREAAALRQIKSLLGRLILFYFPMQSDFMLSIQWQHDTEGADFSKHIWLIFLLIALAQARHMGRGLHILLRLPSSN